VRQITVLAVLQDGRSSLAERRRCRHHWYAQAICARSSCVAGRLVAGVQVLRQARRCHIPKARPGASAVFRTGVDRRQLV